MGQPADENGRTGPGASTDPTDAAILTLDPDGLVESWSRGAEQLTGRSAAEMLGRTITTLLPPDTATRMAALAGECRAKGRASGLLTIRHADGTHVDVRARAECVRGAAGQWRWLVVAVDASPPAHPVMSRAMLEQMVTDSPVGMAVVDADLRFVWSNTAMECFGGGAPEERVGRRLTEIQPDMNPRQIESLLREVLRSGEPQLSYIHIGRPRSEPHRNHAFSMSFVRLEDAAGQGLGVCYTVIDVTDRHRLLQRLTLLDRAGGQIGRTLDVMRTGQELADVAVPHVADFVVVDLLDSVVRGGDPPLGPVRDAETVPMRRAGRRSSVENVPPLVIASGDMITYHSWSPPIRCLTDGTLWRAEKLDPDTPEWAVTERDLSMLELGLHTAMVVPIRARDSTMGVALFFRIQQDEPFAEDDLRLAEELVSRAAVCLDNARRYTREREAALTLQRSLLPQRLPPQPAIRVSSVYRPADELVDAGGDWFDVLALAGARVALVVGDVAGHGIGAVATMGRLRTAVQTLAALDLRPEELLAHLDDLVGLTEEQTSLAANADARPLGASCLYAVYDPISETCTMAGAGHPPPALVSPDGTVRFVDMPVGPRLGVGGLPFEAVETEAEEGSVLAFFTDGLLSGGHDESGGLEHLRRALATPGLSLDALGEKVIEDLVPSRPLDDVTLLLAETRHLNEEKFASWELPADPAVVSRARDTVSKTLNEWGLNELGFTAELIVSELVTNAIRYGSGPIRLRLILGHNLTCEVFDGSSTAPYLRHPRATDEGGRGLFLISQFTHRWGTRYTPDGKIIWTEQLLAPDAADPSGPPGENDALTVSQFS